MSLVTEIEQNIRKGTSIIFLKGFITLARDTEHVSKLEHALNVVSHRLAEEQEKTLIRSKMTRKRLDKFSEKYIVKNER